ncbi:MAG TPA: hypothetical protein ACFCUD_01245 [Cyclobacteriaceae bacterium]
MSLKSIETTTKELFTELENLTAYYNDIIEDWDKNQGNVAVCVITANGEIFGKMFGDDNTKKRKTMEIAWRKASQVWITGYNTGEYEKKVFGEAMDPEDSVVSLPELIGWIGGQKITIHGHDLNIGFSGYRGPSDLEIVKKAVDKISGEGVYS